MRRCFLYFSIACLIIYNSNSSIAQTVVSETINPRTTAVPFLRISPDARASGMGDMGIATSPDAYSSFWNLAKTPFSKNKTSIGFTYAPWLKSLGLSDVYLATLGFNHKLGDGESAIGASLRYFSF